MEAILKSKTKFAKDITMLGKMLYQLRYLKSPHDEAAKLVSAKEFFEKQGFTYDPNDCTQEIIYKCFQNIGPKPSPFDIMNSAFVQEGLQMTAPPAWL